MNLLLVSILGTLGSLGTFGHAVIAVDPSGSTVAFRSCPHAALAQAFLHQVTAKDLENKTPGMVWEVPSGTCPRDNGSAAAAWYRVLSVPCAGEGRHAWKVSVSYWSYNPPRQ